METASVKTHVSRYKAEDENYWRHHLSVFSCSGQTKKLYCKENGVAYDRFFYWIRKLSTSTIQKSLNQKNPAEKMPRLLPVQLNQKPHETQSAALCTLTLKNGYTLHIHDQQSLSFIIDKLA